MRWSNGYWNCVWDVRAIKEKWDPLNGVNGKREIPDKQLYQTNNGKVTMPKSVNNF